MTENELYEMIFEDLKSELSNRPTFDENSLSLKLKQAMREVKSARKYPLYYTKEQIDTDMEAFYSQIRDIALYDYNKRGADFQNSHDENDTDREWVDRDSLFAGILPLSRG